MSRLNQQNDASSDADMLENIPRSQKRRKNYAWRTYWTIVVLLTVGVLALRVFADWLSDTPWPYMESGVWNILIYILIILVLFGCICFFLFHSGWSWKVRFLSAGLVVLAAAAPLVLYEPIFGGGLSLRGLRPRFWKSSAPIQAVSGSADLASETPGDFAQFFGPRRNGIVDGLELSADWRKRPPQVLWRQPVGEGWSGFSTRNGYAVTMQQDGSRECVSCYRVSDGQLIWNYAIESRHENILGGVGPRSTPTIHQGRVYALGAMGDLCCLDGTNGRPIWTADLLALAGIATLQQINSRGEAYEIEQSTVSWGRAASPLIDQSRVIVPLGGESTLIALDAETGDVVWQGGNQTPSYSSPILATVDGTTQIVIVNESSVSGHDPNTGEELWLHARPGSSSGDANTSMATFVDDGKILVSKGYGAGGELLEITRTDDGRYQVASLWKSQRVLKTKLTNAIVRDGCAFAISNELLECVDIATGDRRWRAPRRFGHGQILLVGDHILAHTEHGELVLCAASLDEYRELGRIPTIAGVCWNTMGLYEDKLLVRSDQEMACIELPHSTEDAAARNTPRFGASRFREVFSQAGDPR